jgi:hypothetical protein
VQILTGRGLIAVAKDDIFFAFPLSALAYPHRPPTHVALLDAIRRVAKKIDATERMHEVKHYCADSGIVGYATRPDAPAFILGAKRLGVVLRGTVRHDLEILDEYWEWHRGEKRSDTTVWVRSDLFWDACKGRMSNRRWRVLCGLYARLGPKLWAKVTAGDLRRLTAGLASREEHERAIAGEIHAADYLTPDQIRHTVKALVADSLVTRWTYNRGETFYAHPARCRTTDDLALAVLRHKAKRRGMERSVANVAELGELEAWLKTLSQRI